MSCVHQYASGGCSNGICNEGGYQVFSSEQIFAEKQCKLCFRGIFGKIFFLFQWMKLQNATKSLANITLFG